jgi:hypothetical protein
VAPARQWEHVSSPVPLCETWQRDVKDGHLTVIVGREPEGWHLSISHRTNSSPPRPGRNPKWGEIKEARYRFTPADVTMAMILPPMDEYVNVMETCFHLWQIDK